MEKSLFEKLQDVKRDAEIAQVCICNDRKVRKDGSSFSRKVEDIDSAKEFGKISEYLVDAAELYSSFYRYDSMKMKLILGLVFKREDVNGLGMVKPEAEPLDDVVRYYTGSVKSYKHGLRSNLFDYQKIGRTKDGYISFSELMNLIRESGLQYDGPESFEEFKERILVGLPFNISLSAQLNSKEQPKAKTDEKKFVK